MSEKEMGVEVVAAKILIVRGRKVMLDRDLAQLYGVTTGALNQAVKRNQSRFPSDFMYQLTREEVISLISQFVISKRGGQESFHMYLQSKAWQCFLQF
ncbi:MAG: ORF6N domain-containing protein [Candidatus Omnitrophica bacterium]|nr:ORF6N domain-containing protein [Candidatus Omnitrophota bacterium]